MAFRLGYRPALAGVRGIAILTVMVVHAGLPFPSGGFLSVDVFFVLSGFLITSVLLEEWQKTGSIRLGKFYLRRSLRLLPPLSVLLVCLTVFSFTFPVRAQAIEIWREVLFTVFYMTNWALAFGAMSAMGPLGHGWTLAIEEQFYLVWPLMLLLLLRAGFALRTVAMFTAGLIAMAAINRFVLWESGTSIDRLFFGFDTRCDTILVGCLGGVFASLPDRNAGPGARVVMRVVSRVAVAVLAVMVAVVSHDVWYMYCGGFTVAAIAIMIILFEIVEQPAFVLSRILASPPMVHIGNLSYGLYLWHWPVFLSFMPASLGWSVASTNVVRFAVTFALAEVSLYLVERPFLSLKKRYHHRGA